MVRSAGSTFELESHTGKVVARYRVSVRVSLAVGDGRLVHGHLRPNAPPAQELT